MNNKTRRQSNLGVLDLLLVAFVVLKLCRVIQWSWAWVLAPVWIPVAVGCVMALATAITDKD